MHESELLTHIAASSRTLGELFPAVETGPGDDCAVIRAPGGDRLLLTVDQAIEGRHFRGPLGVGTPIDLVARKAIARSISDLAAMAGSPLACLATAAFPPSTRDEDARLLADALRRWAEHFGCPLVGGDLASFSHAAPLTLTVTAVGLAHAARGAVLRSGARPGDALYVTGELGGSFDAETGLGHHLTFEPRCREGVWLADTLGPALHAMMDLSDGLGRDAERMARASGVRFELEAELLPRRAGINDWRRACGDGEDYELLFAADPSISLPPRCPTTGTPITRVGRVAAGEGCAARLADGSSIDIAQMGWDH